MGFVRTLGSTASAPGISPHWHSLGLVLDILEVGEGALELPAVDGLRGLAGVLERDTEVGAASAGALCGLEVRRSVSDLGISISMLSEICALDIGIPS